MQAEEERKQGQEEIGRHEQPGECFLFISVSQRPPRVQQVCLGTALERAIDPTEYSYCI